MTTWGFSKAQADAMTSLWTSLYVIVGLKGLQKIIQLKMKARGPEFKYVVILEEKDKGNPKIQNLRILKFVGCLKFVKIREFLKFVKFVKFEFSNYEFAY